LSTPLLMREIIAALTVSGTSLYTKVGTRVYAAPAQFDAQSAGLVIALVGGTSNAHAPVWTARTEIWAYGGRTSNDARIDACSEVYQVLSDRCRDIEMYTTANSAVVMDVVEVSSEEINEDLDRNIPVSVSVWDWQIRPNS